MAKLITKFKYLKPNARTSVGGYAKYIATREGVDKIDQSFKLAPTSLKQKQLIEKILTDRIIISSGTLRFPVKSSDVDNVKE